MDPHCKNNYKNFLRRLFLPLILLLLSAAALLKDEIAHASVLPGFYFNKIFTDTVPKTVPAPAAKDTLPRRTRPGNDSIPVRAADTAALADSLASRADSLVTDTTIRPVRISKDSLTAPVYYKAQDSIVMFVKKKEFHLYTKADVKYEQTQLTGHTMDFNQASGVLTSRMGLDSAGKVIEKAALNDGTTSSEMDSVQYNFNSAKAMIYQTRAQYGEGYVSSRKVKKQPDNTVFGFRNGYTTCNLDTPHFAFRARKIKVIPDKLIVSGPANLEIEGIPTPLFIPFAIFPISHGQRTGLLPPQYVVNQQKGIGLENGGYYFGLGEYLDLTVRGEVYSYGSWGLTFSPTYRKRYKYNGGFNLAFSSSKFGGDPQIKEEFSTSKDFRVSWSHSMDGKARPGTNFSASVNFGTTSYNQFNVTDAATRLNNNMSSSINYSKSWVGKPYNLTLAAGHNQNNQTRKMNINFPDASFNVNTLYPFQKKEMVGTPRWFEKIGISYNGLLRNNVSFVDSTFGKPAMFDNMQAGVQHQIPITLSIPVARNLTLSPSINYTEKWYIRQQVLSWDNKNRNYDTSYNNGFYRSSAMSAGASLATAVYGMYTFKNKNAKVQAIRHVMRPNIGMSFSPDLASKDYYMVQNDTLGHMTRFSYYDGAPFGPSPSQTFAGLTFGIDNNLEMKVKSDKDTSGMKKIKLLDGFGITSSYNLVADSFRLAPFALNARTNLFDKVNISFGATLDPYQVDKYGYRIDKYVWQGQKFSIGRLTNANIAMSTSFQSQDKKSKEKEQQKEELAEEEQSPDAMLLEQQRQAQMMRANPGDYVDFDIPWRLDLSYSLNYTRGRSQDRLRDTTIFNQYLGFSGDFSLTPKWKIIMSSGFDFVNKQIAYTNLTISRDLHCWQLSINLVPFGTYRQFSITINPKAGILRDLRINRTRQFQDF
ncbi:LPS-assembly protein LptD [Chitinophaga lutea]|uniref:LPS-assembly protein LptD n=1 Tax=Chitinophaga lutea TaxID=2488634 RepID=A0A3N4PK35_9BACT|nr:putative LPS assembly protein LptD [Chitinophaga lutea]RPE09043.1 LPS-assembly protein LptD [Chitinophaga lutea]